MNKVLSVCVPSYNMEKYLNRCIDSFLVPEVLDQLEIIIVNDGSTDNTLSIANGYKEDYPRSIVVIDKPNGHYGSCVNASLKVATGKYFRIVDADDWVDSESLVTFINILEKIDVDCVCTNFTVHNLNDNSIRIINTQVAPIEKKLDLNLLSLQENCFRMHCLTFSLSLLRRIAYNQTEGICYSDTEYSYLPLSCSENMCFINISLYQYFIGRSNQSVAPEVLQKNFKHLLEEINLLQKEHVMQYPFNKNEPMIYASLMNRLFNMAVPLYLLYNKYDKIIDDQFRHSITDFKKKGFSCNDLMNNTMFHVPYVSLWFYSRPFSKFVTSIIKLLKFVH